MNNALWCCSEYTQSNKAKIIIKVTKFSRVSAHLGKVFKYLLTMVFAFECAPGT
jgi:hypothetical protein